MNPPLSRLMTSVFAVLDPHAFVHWIEAIPGVFALPINGKRYRLLFEQGVPTMREDHAGRKQNFEFVEELQVHLLSRSKALLIQEVASYPAQETAL